MGLFSKLFRKGGHNLTPDSPWGVPFPTNPAQYDLDDVVHVWMLDDIRQRYATLLMHNDTGPYAGCMFRPSSLLPFPKPVISAALTALLAFVESRRESKCLDRAMRNPQMADTISACLNQLEDFLDVDPHDLPTDQLENVRIGFELAGQRPDRPTHQRS